MTYNIIGDIAGRFDELMLLLPKMPKADKIILVGDMMDRGAKSKEVIEWAMCNPDVIAIKGNHEDMMVDHFRKTKRYGTDIWLSNGGDKTLHSYGYETHCSVQMYSERYDILKEGDVPEAHIAWLEKLPIFFQDKGLFVSHAPWNGSFNLGKFKSEEDALWNRFKPSKYDDIFQVFGHNGSLKAYGNHAMCIDNSSKKQLWGIHFPTKQLIEQEYL